MKADTGSCQVTVRTASASISRPLVISTEAMKRSTRRTGLARSDTGMK